MRTPAKDGFEAGIMRLEPSHPYLLQSSMERQFMDGFRRGRDRRAWLDGRGQNCRKNWPEQLALAITG